MDLNGKVALVTGSARGIGFAIGCRLHQQGAAVIFNDREASPAVLDYVKTHASGNKAIFYQADISQLAQIQKMVNSVADDFERLDILVNNAGIDPGSPFLEVNEETWQRVIDTNLKGSFFCAQNAAAKMRERGHGCIINISSVHSQATMPGFSVYAASKGALNSLTRELALELAPYGITVNAVAPGAIEVERFVSNPIYDPQALAGEIPCGRVGKPEDVSGIVAFLCSEDAAWLTGQIITVDGGTLTRLYLYAGRPIPSGTGPETKKP